MKRMAVLMLMVAGASMLAMGLGIDGAAIYPETKILTTNDVPAIVAPVYDAVNNANSSRAALGVAISNAVGELSGAVEDLAPGSAAGLAALKPSDAAALSVAEAQRIVQADTNAWLVLSGGTGVLYQVSEVEDISINTNSVIITQVDWNIDWGGNEPFVLPQAGDVWSWGYSATFDSVGYVGNTTDGDWLIANVEAEYWAVLDSTFTASYWESSPAFEPGFYCSENEWYINTAWNGTITNSYLVTNCYTIATTEYVDNAVTNHDTAIDAHTDIRSGLSDHTNNTSNPHNVTLTQVGGISSNTGVAIAQSEVSVHNTNTLSHSYPWTSNQTTIGRWDTIENNVALPCYWKQDTNTFAGASSTNFYKIVPQYSDPTDVRHGYGDGLFVGKPGGATGYRPINPETGTSWPDPHLYLRDINGSYFRSEYLHEGLGTLSFYYCMRHVSVSPSTVDVQVTSSALPTSGWTTILTTNTSVTTTSTVFFSLQVNRRDVRYWRVLRTDPSGAPGVTLSDGIPFDGIMATPCLVTSNDYSSVQSMWIVDGKVCGIKENEPDSIGIGPWIGGMQSLLRSDGTNLFFIPASRTTTNSITSN